MTLTHTEVIKSNLFLNCFLQDILKFGYSTQRQTKKTGKWLTTTG